MSVLLDANVLVALVVADHIHHKPAEVWFARLKMGFASCPITQGSLLRLLVREGQPPQPAMDFLRVLSADSRHEFWPDDIPYEDVPLRGVVGHRQVTDAYLAELSRRHAGRLASFDQGLAKMHQDVVDLVPVVPA